MLPKKRRIERKEFEYILKTGERYNSPHLLLYIAKTDAPLSRFSVSISKKIFKHAVDRNLYRRRGYNSIHTFLPNIIPGFLVFFSFKKGKYPLSFTELHTEILYLLKLTRMLL